MVIGCSGHALWALLETRPQEVKAFHSVRGLQDVDAQIVLAGRGAAVAVGFPDVVGSELQQLRDEVRSPWVLPLDNRIRFENSVEIHEIYQKNFQILATHF